MKIIIGISIFSLIINLVNAQPNCLAYAKDECKKACEIAVKAERIQWTMKGQSMFDEAIALCPSISYSWREKAVPYLKIGDFLTWKTLIDKAVEYEPKANLGYRGWCRYQFFRDYEGAIKDIELLEQLTKSNNIGYSQNGDYHLEAVKSICYYALNQREKALSLMKAHVETENLGYYDYYQLGVMYFNEGDLSNAKVYFDKQSEKYELADNLYYKCRIEKNVTKKKLHKTEALKLYKEGKTLKDIYTHHFNKVYYSMIEKI
jgi:tetratricopeptide (TPR) repeat protein